MGVKYILTMLGLILQMSVYGQANIFPGSGNVGIGTLLPLTRLHVVGDVRFERQDFDGKNYLSIHSTSGGSFVTSDDTGSNQKNLFLRVSPTGVGSMDRHMYFQAGKNADGSFLTRMIIQGNGNVGIGTTNPLSKLEVNGTIRAKEIKLEATGWPNYVFEDGYQLMPLEEVKAHIDTNGHLPGLKPATEYEAEGVNMRELNRKLLEKVEELTLHSIAQEVKFKYLEAELETLKQLLKERP